MRIMSRDEAHFVVEFEGPVADVADLVGLVPSGGEIARVGAACFCRQLYPMISAEDRQYPPRVIRRIRAELASVVATASAAATIRPDNCLNALALPEQMPWGHFKKVLVKKFAGIELIRRLVLALDLRGWRLCASAALLDGVLSGVSAEDVHEPGLDRAAHVLDDLRDHLRGQLRELDVEGEWLDDIISQEASFRSESYTIRTLHYLLSLPKGTRYSLPHKLNRYAAIQLWVADASLTVQKSLSTDDLLWPRTTPYHGRTASDHGEDEHDFGGDGERS